MGQEEKIAALMERLGVLQEVLQNCVEGIGGIKAELEALKIDIAKETERAQEQGKAMDNEAARENLSTADVEAERPHVPAPDAQKAKPEEILPFPEGNNPEEELREMMENTAPELMATGKHEVNEQLKPRQTIADRVNYRPLNDLKSAMGINERFLYANELFKGDMEAFNKALDELNHLDSGSDAEKLLDQQLAPKYNWEDESKYVTAFRDLVNRKFQK